MTTIMTTHNNETYENMQKQEEYSIEEYEQELNYFQEYDQEMLDTIEHYEEDCIQQENSQEEEEEPYEMDESLLKLIVDVQSYLAEAPTDSPLFALQYKMYTYLKQRAFEMGMDVPNLSP